MIKSVDKTPKIRQYIYLHEHEHYPLGISMKEQLITLIQQSVTSLINQGILDTNVAPKIQVTPTKQKLHGDYACNIALMLAKPAKCNPRQLAEKIITHLPKSDLITKTEIAGPGFINFFLNHSAQFEIIKKILDQKEDYGKSNLGNSKKVNVEFVSANPTGPLHVGHGRGAAIGSAIASILEYSGHNVTREYYVNDAGRQMDILATSVWLRYLELLNLNPTFPTNGYKGQYIYDIAQALKDEHQDAFSVDVDALYKDIPADYNSATEAGDKEKYIDGLIQNAKSLLGDKYNIVHKTGLDSILDDIKTDLAEFNVDIDVWFSERSLMTSNDVKNAIQRLEDNNLLYTLNDAKWFKAESLGDEKDRVVVRNNGQSTYFASDAAYMTNKFNRGFDDVIYLFGADHHGYVARLRALAQAFEFKDEQIHIPLVQFAILYQGGEQVQMSTRSGSFVTLRDLREEVGNDATRYFYIMRKADQHLDFDLDLAKSKSNENPVYYIQYAHARICSVFRQLQEQNKTYQPELGLEHLNKLVSDHELAIVNKIALFQDVINKASVRLEPHLLTTYMRELANLFHTYYNADKFIVEDQELTQARLTLIFVLRQVFANALNLLGISAPEKM